MQVPTGGNGTSLARERLTCGQGQQTRCDSGADGIVRIKRERDIFTPVQEPSCWGLELSCFLHALFLLS